MNDNKTTHAFDHFLRETHLAECKARDVGADLHIICTASLLHNIARMESNHHITGTHRSRKLLAGSSKIFIDSVAHCIEAECLCDADKLDANEAIVVARTFAVAGLFDNRL